MEKTSSEAALSSRGMNEQRRMFAALYYKSVDDGKMPLFKRMTYYLFPQ
jgi:hypothetical protein